MRIAILGSVALTVPPIMQGGTEWIAYYQAKGLSDLGHEVVLIAAKGSKQEGKYRLIEVGGGDAFKQTGSGKFGEIEGSRPMRKEIVYLTEVVEKLIEHKDEYDLILNNMRGEALFLPLVEQLKKPFVNVMHLPMFPELAGIFKHYNTSVITISNNQRKEFPDLNYLATVYNCVDTEKYRAPDDARLCTEDYLLMMGTIGRHKNQGAAIRIAKKLGIKLVLAGKIRDKDYFEELKKDIDGGEIKYFGELDFQTKIELYKNAKAFIFPILWEEPFGLVMIEAMACGTPVVAFNNGAISEVVIDSKTGYIIDNNSEDEMAKAVQKIGEIKREDCRKHVMDNFSVEKMVRAYEEALMKLT